MDWHPSSPCGSDIHFLCLVHSDGNFVLETLSVAYKKQKSFRGGNYCCSMRWFRRCSKAQPGNETTWAPNSCMSWNFYFCKWAGQALASWSHAESLAHRHGRQWIFGWICLFLKTLHSSLICQNHTCFVHPIDWFLLHAPLWEIWLLQTESHAVKGLQWENTVAAKLWKSPADNS